MMTWIYWKDQRRRGDNKRCPRFFHEIYNTDTWEINHGIRKAIFLTYCLECLSESQRISSKCSKGNFVNISVFPYTLLCTNVKAWPINKCYYYHNIWCAFIEKSSQTLTTIIGSLGRLNQTSFRKILAFSSINHLSWISTAIFIRHLSWTLYFLFQSVISAPAALLFNPQQQFYISWYGCEDNITLGFIHFSFQG